MKKTKFTEEQIAFALKQAEIGTRVAAICCRMMIRSLYCLILSGGGAKKNRQRGIARAKALHAEYRRRKRMLAIRLGQLTGKSEGMALTRDFKQTMVERVKRDPAFAKPLLDEAATLFLNGDPGTARAVLRDLVNATISFEQLAALTDKPSKSLHWMLSLPGNPSMDSLSDIFGAIGRCLKVSFEAHPVEIA